MKLLRLRDWFWPKHSIRRGILRIGIMALAAVILWPVAASAEDAFLAQGLCFLERADGSVVDLTHICSGGQSSNRAASPQQAFLQGFSQAAEGYPADVQQDLQRYTRSQRDSALASGQSVCRAIRYGGPEAGRRRLEGLMAYNSSAISTARHQITYELAMTHLCPELGGT